MPASFFCKTTAKNVWKTVTCVSSAGSKRGRGKGAGRIIAKDFNRGQLPGVGPKTLIMPGLNAPVFNANRLRGVEFAGENRDFKNNLETERKKMNVYRKFRDHPMERGWSGRRAHGKKAGPPDDYNDTSLEEFDSIILMLRPIMRMTGVLGRVKTMNAIVVTGNRNGLAGFASVNGKDGRSVVRHARNKAAQSLVYVPRWEEHTVLHDFYSRYYDTTVFVQRKPKGYGIRAHRIIKAICEMFGITDLYAKVEGVTDNQANLTRAFFLGLMNQKKYQDIANEKKLHLVELREEKFYYPQILASPEGKVLTDGEIKSSSENLDFTYYIYDGRIKMVQPTKRNKYEDDPTWNQHLTKLDYFKNREKTKLLLAAKYGDRKVLDVFPYFRSNATSFNKPNVDEAQ